MKYIFGLFLLLVPFLFSMAFHPVYISNTEIDYKPDTKKIEIAIKVFSDDLQLAISKEYGKDVEIGTDREPTNAKELIIEYLQKHFRIELNGKVVAFEYVNRHVEKKEQFATWILVQVPKVSKIKNLKLFNDILINMHSEQQNIINYREGSGSYSKFITRQGYTSVVLK